MLRISWPLALLLAIVLVLVARRPQLLEPILLVFVIWFIWEQVKRKKK
jgi:hypothetical protein